MQQFLIICNLKKGNSTFLRINKDELEVAQIRSQEKETEERRKIVESMHHFKLDLISFILLFAIITHQFIFVKFLVRMIVKSVEKSN